VKPGIKLAWKVSMLKHINEIVPTNRMGGFLVAELEKDSGVVCLVEPSRQVPHIQEIIMNASFLDECALGFGYKLTHMGKSFGPSFLQRSLQWHGWD
jgi:hypothetical protein